MNSITHPLNTFTLLLTFKDNSEIYEFTVDSGMDAIVDYVLDCLKSKNPLVIHTPEEVTIVPYTTLKQTIDIKVINPNEEDALH